MMRTIPLLQCRNCGTIYKANTYISTDLLYCNNICNQCKKMTNNLVLSSDPEDIYLLYDPVDDPRFYEYKE